MRKFFLRTAAVLLIVAVFFTSAIVGAAVQTFDGQGQWQTIDDDAMQLVAMERSLQRAQRDAREKIKNQLKNRSNALNVRISDSEIDAITTKFIENVSDTHIEKKNILLNDTQPIVLYTAEVNTKIDSERGIQDFIKRDDKEKSAIAEQNYQLQEAIRRNDEIAASLVNQYYNVTTQAERDRIRKQIDDVDREFLANQKLEETFKLWDNPADYDKAIELCNEALKLKPNYAQAYAVRAMFYSYARQDGLALADFNKAIELEPTAENYFYRANFYSARGKRDLALADYTKIIELEPTDDNYIVRANFYEKYLKNYELALADYNKAIEIAPIASRYNNRALFYKDTLKNYELAIKDYTKAIKLSKRKSRTDKYILALIYGQRGEAYFEMKNYDAAFADFNKAIELEPNSDTNYKRRGKFYQKLGENSKAQADFAKAKQLGYNG